MKQIVWAALFCATLGVPAAASAATGVVVLNPSGCGGRFVVETSMGYAILEWFGGHDPDRGEKVRGDFESYGMKDIYFDGDNEGKVWVEDFWLSRSRALEKMANFCD